MNCKCAGQFVSRQPGARGRAWASSARNRLNTARGDAATEHAACAAPPRPQHPSYAASLRQSLTFQRRSAGEVCVPGRIARLARTGVHQKGGCSRGAPRSVTCRLLSREPEPRRRASERERQHLAPLSSLPRALLGGRATRQRQAVAVGKTLSDARSAARRSAHAEGSSSLSVRQWLASSRRSL